MRRPRSGRPGGQLGSATVWLLCGCTLLLGLSGALVSVGAAVVARHRASVVADLAALAGAQAMLAGAPACPAAGRVAQAQRGSVVRCSVTFAPGAAAGPVGVVDVVAEVSDSPMLAYLLPARARARAGSG